MSRTIVNPEDSICMPLETAWIARRGGEAGVEGREENELGGSGGDRIGMDEAPGADGGPLRRQRGGCCRKKAEDESGAFEHGSVLRKKGVCARESLVWLR